ncbi:MAG TPA: hypothetical protein PKK48_07615 [Phycisphaerae bacterium]|nr:hypothetical protein [Phycisphaerae bacterium]HPS52893.1 hypothetical protein [Phycisphaerae bacterium]
MGQRKDRRAYRKKVKAEVKVSNAPRKAKGRIRNAARRAEIEKKLEQAGY